MLLNKQTKWWLTALEKKNLKKKNLKEKQKRKSSNLGAAFCFNMVIG